MKRALAGLLLVLLCVAAPATAEVEPAFSVEVGSPLKLSGNIGIRIGTVKKDGSDYGRGFLLQAQPGLGGVAFNLGWAPVALPSWGTQAVGVAIKARVLRTWGDPWGGFIGTSFAGPAPARACGGTERPHRRALEGSGGPVTGQATPGGRGDSHLRGPRPTTPPSPVGCRPRTG